MLDGNLNLEAAELGTAAATLNDPVVAREALAGLQRRIKTLPSKLFYDEAGCVLFDETTRLPEYYATRTEQALLRRLAPEIARAAPQGAALVEYGACDEA